MILGTNLIKQDKVLVTGGAGYIGSVLTRELLNKGYRVTVLDSLEFNQLSLLPFVTDSNFTFIHGDVRNTTLLKKLVGDVDIVIPLAAIVGFPACNQNPEVAKEINYVQVKNIVDWVEGTDKKVLYPNTNSGYGIGEDNTECTEESELNPISVYGQTKVDAEKYILNKIDGICFRLATVFGVSPRMRTDLLVNDFTYKALSDNYIVVFEKHFKRNYIHVQDVASVIIFMIENYDKYKGNVFNVGLSSANFSKQELLEKIKTHIPNFNIIYNNYYKDPDKRDYIVSNKKIEKTGWRPTKTLDVGILELIKAYKIIIPNMGREFRNSIPLGYFNTISSSS